MAQTVLVTGATGFIAKHIVLQLLNTGYHVVGSVRSAARDAELRAAISPHLDDPSDLDQRLKTVELDLNSDAGWGSAMHGIDILMHTASPFPMDQPKDEQDLIRPAVEGTRRALKAADTAGIKRVVLTSSTVSVASAPLPERGYFMEDDWSDLTYRSTVSYTKSKTLAEQAAWDFVKSQAPEMELTTINPGLVLGTPLDANYGTSIKIIERLMNGIDPMIPNFGFAVVDVKDVAAMHVKALNTPASIGQRLLCVSDSAWFKDIADILAAEYPDRKIATLVAPDILMRVLGLFDKAIKSILPQLGDCPPVSNQKAQDILGMDFIPVEQAVKDSAAFLVSHGLVKS